MDKRLAQVIFKKYDSLFEQRQLPPTQTTMYWRLDVGDGWFRMIHELCEKIVALDPKAKADQVKEKYGTLRFYITGDERLEALVDEAENQSETTCEVCGEPGVLESDGWYAVRCEQHTSTHNKRVDPAEQEAIVQSMLEWAKTKVH